MRHSAGSLSLGRLSGAFSSIGARREDETNGALKDEEIDTSTSAVPVANAARLSVRVPELRNSNTFADSDVGSDDGTFLFLNQ